MTNKEQEMTITKEQAVEGIQYRLDQLESIKTDGDFENWRKTTLVFLDTIYGSESAQYATADDIRIPISFSRDTSQSEVRLYCDKVKQLLHGFLEGIRIFGLPQRMARYQAVQNQFNLSQQQQQQQNQSIERTIEQAVQELPEELVERIQQIVRKGGPRTTMMQRIFEDLKNLEIGTAASVLSTILTNFYLGTMG